MGSRVSRPTGRTSFSVISAKAKAALRCRSTLSEKDSVVKAERGCPVKKLVVVRSVGKGFSRTSIEEDLTRTHSQDTEGDRPQPPVRSRGAMARKLAICAPGL